MAIQTTVIEIYHSELLQFLTKNDIHYWDGHVVSSVIDLYFKKCDVAKNLMNNILIKSRNEEVRFDIVYRHNETSKSILLWGQIINGNLDDKNSGWFEIKRLSPYEIY